MEEGSEIDPELAMVVTKARALRASYQGKLSATQISLENAENREAKRFKLDLLEATKLANAQGMEKGVLVFPKDLLSSVPTIADFKRDYQLLLAWVGRPDIEAHATKRCMLQQLAYKMHLVLHGDLESSEQTRSFSDCVKVCALSSGVLWGERWNSPHPTPQSGKL